jgi:hypothetical protein
MHIGYWWASQMKRDTRKTEGDNIKMDLREIGWDGMVWIGLMWLRIRTSGGLL